MPPSDLHQSRRVPPQQSSWALTARLPATTVPRACLLMPSLSPSSMILKLPSLSTSINGFRLDDRATESIAAYNRKHIHHNQGETIGARFSQLAWGENPAACERRIVQAFCGQLSDHNSTSYHLFGASAVPLHRIGSLMTSMAGDRM